MIQRYPPRLQQRPPHPVVPMQPSPVKAAQVVLAMALLLAADVRLYAELRVSPGKVALDSPEASQQLLVSGPPAAGPAVDLTRQVRYEVRDAAIATVDAAGLVQPRG